MSSSTTRPITQPVLDTIGTEPVMVRVKHEGMWVDEGYESPSGFYSLQSAVIKDCRIKKTTVAAI